MKSDGRARLSLVHESFSFVCGQKANMGICHSTAHLRVALEGRSSRSIFPVDTVWGDLLLTCSYRMRGGLGLERNHSGHVKDRGSALRYASALATVWSPQGTQNELIGTVYVHPGCVAKASVLWDFLWQTISSHDWLSSSVFIETLRGLLLNFFDHLELTQNPTSYPAPAFLTLKTYALAKIPMEPSGACFCVPPTQSSEWPFLNVCLSHGL